MKTFKELYEACCAACEKRADIEEVKEPIDELSKSTLRKYGDAAHEQESDIRHTLKRTEKSKHLSSGAKDELRKLADRRKAGIKLAADKRGYYKGSDAKANFTHGDAKVPANEEVEEIDERNKENALRRKVMDASRGARYKLDNKVPDREPQHKTAQAHNKAIGRALRSEESELDEARNTYALYDDHPKFKDAHNEIHGAVTNAHKDPKAVVKAMRKHKQVGATDSQSREYIYNRVKRLHGAKVANSTKVLDEEVEQIDESEDAVARLADKLETHYYNGHQMGGSQADKESAIQKVKHHISKAPTKHLKALHKTNMGWENHRAGRQQGLTHPVVKHIASELKNRGVMQEEVEQIDELSKTTVKSYEDKARMDQNDTLGIALRKYSSPEERAKYKAIADKRGRGRALALAKLSPNGTRLHSDRTVAKQAKVVAKEETDRNQRLRDALAKIKNDFSNPPAGHKESEPSKPTSAPKPKPVSGGMPYYPDSHGGKRYMGDSVEMDGEQIEETLHPKLTKRADELRSAGHSVSYVGQGYHAKTKKKIGMIRYTDANTGGKIAKTVHLEEVEQIDELSKETVKSYLDKVRFKAARSFVQANMGSPGMKKKHSAELDKTARSMDSARARLAKEEVETIDEISAKTLSSYIDKATHDHSKHRGTNILLARRKLLKKPLPPLHPDHHKA